MFEDRSSIIRCQFQGDPYYWYLAITILLLAFETVFTLAIKVMFRWLMILMMVMTLYDSHQMATTWCYTFSHQIHLVAVKVIFHGLIILIAITLHDSRTLGNTRLEVLLPKCLSLPCKVPLLKHDKNMHYSFQNEKLKFFSLILWSSFYSVLEFGSKWLKEANT